METPATDYSKLSTKELYELTAKAEGYESVPVDIDTFLNDPHYLGQTYDEGKAVYPYWREALHQVFPNPLYSPYEEVCLSGDTSVDLLDGRSLTMAEICAMGPDVVFWVLAFNTNTRKWEPCKAGAPKMTGIKPVYKITLDNGESFKATGNHKILGRDNRWHRTDSLKVGQSLMPYNLTYNDAGYAYIWDHSSRTNVKRARLVQRWKNGIPAGWQTHHKNQIRQDDRPSNIIALRKETHIELHGRMFHESIYDPIKGPAIRAKLSEAQERARNADPAHYAAIKAAAGKISWALKTPEDIEKMRKGQKEWVNSPEGIANSSRIMAEYNRTHPEELKARGKVAARKKWANAPEKEHERAARHMSAMNANPEFQAKAAAGNRAANLNKLLKRLNQMPGLQDTHPKKLPYPLQRVIARNFGCFKPGTENIDNGLLVKKWPEIVENARNYNHRIVSIEILPPEPVYNFTVDRLHNYPLTCGVISSNCVTGCIGAGKALSINELVICKAGKKKAKHVTLADEILGTDGNYYPVLGIFPQGIKHTYALYVQLETARASASGKAPYDRVITSDDHIWTVYEGGRKYDTTTKEIVRGLNEDKVYSLPVMKGTPGRYFCGWADTGDHECVCFKVGSPDHLFAVGNYTFTHNTSFAIMGALYDLYHVTLLREPQRKYKLLTTTRIIFSLVTATKDLASAVMANQMLDVIAASPYFCSKFMPKKGEKLDEDMFPHHVGVGFGSRGGHNLGKAVIGAIIDEANFQEAVANQAVKNYETITRRMASRFMLKNGSLPCRRWLVSSRNSDSSFLESHIEAVKDNPKVLVLAPAIWDVQGAKGIYSGKTFPVFIGTNTQQPMICTTESEVEEHAGYIIEVPDIYRDQFEENLPGALMDLAGVASRSSMALIYNVEKWISCQCLDNAISKDEITLSLDGVDKIMDYIVKDLPKYSYYVHLDGALKGDRFGFAMSAIEKQMTVSGRNLLTGEQTLRLSPSLITPIAFGIKARPGSEVPLWKVRQFLLDLRNKGVTIMQVSSDGFQSADMRQMLEKMGFNVKYVSVDTTKDPYLKFASNVNHGLMKVPKSPILDFEVRHLENRDKKIDHPDKVMVNGRYVKGSKDIADAVAASQHEALLASMSLAAGTLIDQIRDVQNMPMRSRQEYVQDLIFGMAQGDPSKHIAGGLY